MIDSRFQLVLDDIDAAIASRKAADAAIDDARTKLADMVDEGLPAGHLLCVNQALRELNYSIRLHKESRTYSATYFRLLETARTAITRAIQRRP